MTTTTPAPAELQWWLDQPHGNALKDYGGLPGEVRLELLVGHFADLLAPLQQVNAYTVRLRSNASVATRGELTLVWQVYHQLLLEFVALADAVQALNAERRGETGDGLAEARAAVASVKASDAYQRALRWEEELRESDKEAEREREHRPPLSELLRAPYRESEPTSTSAPTGESEPATQRAPSHTSEP